MLREQLILLQTGTSDAQDTCT